MKTNDVIFRTVLVVMIVLLVWLAGAPLRPPRAVESGAPAAQFSAGRAMADLEIVAREPHAAGSDAQARVRAYIVEQVQALGLAAEVETNEPVSNILVRLPGTDPTQTVLVTGHYDSQPPAPGAGDDGLSTVAMLEAIRVLRASPPLRNDILFLFTDGEELGWRGAYAFLRQNPKAKETTGVVLCFDGLPGNAPLTLVETSPGDAWLVRQMTGLPLAFTAGSWTNRVERGELDTDCSVFFQAGFTGVEIENEDAGTRYHTPRDTADAISPDLVQGFGQTMVALAGHFGSIDLADRSAGSDLAYFTLPLVGLVAYPTWLMPLLSGLGLAALLACVVVAWRRRLFTFGRFGLSLLALAVGAVLLVAAAQLAWGVITDAYAQEIAGGIGFEASSAWLTGLMLAAIALMATLIAWLSHRLGTVHLVPAAALLFLGAWFAVHLLLDADQPLETAYAALPLLGGIAGLAVLLFVKNPAWKNGLLAACALVILVMLVPQLWLGSYTREDAWIPVLAASLPVGFFAPQIAVVFGAGDGE